MFFPPSERVIEVKVLRLTLGIRSLTRVTLLAYTNCKYKDAVSFYEYY